MLFFQFLVGCGHYYGVLNSCKIWTKLTILSTEGGQDSEFRLFFGRIQEAIIYFQDFVTFSVS